MNYDFTARQAVEAGVVLLDEFYPGWEELIDWDTLDIWSLSDCIIGQLRKTYGIWGLLNRMGLRDFHHGRRYGFNGIPYDHSEGCAEMTQAWQDWRKEQIA